MTMTGMMEMLDKNKPFITHVGSLQDGIKYSQNGKGYDNSGKMLGHVKDGRLVTGAPINVEPPEPPEQPTAPPPDNVTPANAGETGDAPVVPPLEMLTPNKPDSAVNLDGMDRPALLAYAQDKYGQKLKGNASADDLREQIINLGG